MASPDELRAKIDQSREAFRGALGAAAGAWETKPASGEGEAAWSPREVAEHAIPSEVFFATKVCEACGYPGLTWEGARSFDSAEAAIEAFDAAIAMSNGRLKYVTDADLPKKKDETSRSAEEYLGINAWHMNDHAAQLRATTRG